MTLRSWPSTVNSGVTVSPALVVAIAPAVVPNADGSNMPPDAECVVTSTSNLTVTGGSAILNADNDAVTFDNLAVSGTPGASGTLQVTCTRGSEVQVLPLSVSVRSCVLGEVTPVGSVRCVECTAPTYSIVDGATACATCPDGAECYGGSALIAQQGFWRFNRNSSITFHACVMETACLGATEPSTTAADGRRRLADTSMERCADGYSGIMCDTCEPGYAKTGSSCASCYSTAVTMVIAVAASLLIVGVIGVMIRGNVKAKGRGTLHVGFGKVLLGHFQVNWWHAAVV